MSAHTSIEFSDSSCNPFPCCPGGCELHNKKLSTCYAARITAEWQGAKGWPKSFDTPTFFDGRVEKCANMVDLRGKDRTDKPWLNGLPRHVFVNDMGDLFDKSVPFDWINEQVLKPIGSPKGSRHIYFLFTKRAQRQAEFIKWYRETQGILPQNVIWMVSVTSPATLKRLETLLEIPNIIRGVSLEPLLAPMTGLMKTIVRGSNDLHWMVTGAESGPDHRACEENWIREIRDVAAELEIAFFYKQGVDADGSKRSVPLLDGVRHVAMPTVIGDNLF
jgi:protein gp37